MSDDGITKRGFIAGVAAVAASASSLLGALRAPSRGSGASGAGDFTRGAGAGWAAQLHDVDLVIYNERYADARAFAQVHAERGIATLALEGDAGVLWYGQLRARIAAGERRIAGVGTHTDYFILHTLARESGLRVRSSARIRACPDNPGLLVSWILA